MNFKLHWSALLLTASSLLAVLPAARADDVHASPSGMPAAYVQECASCHAAYPPGMLPARSWQRVMAGLDRHYGTDASLDPSTAHRLGAWLQSQAAANGQGHEEPPQDRITRSAWFERRHREVTPSTWKLASVRSAANCSACHAGADHGDFDDDSLRVPAGLDARARRAWND